jgi:hypothetical protein
MIPAFNDSGFLPPGVHAATLAEIAERFGGASELRRVQMDSLRWMIDLALRAGVERIVLNGSFVTDTMEPNDVDCVLLVGAGFPGDSAAEKELRAGLPFLDVSLVDQADFDYFVQRFFAWDRGRNEKGMIEVIL